MKFFMSKKKLMPNFLAFYNNEQFPYMGDYARDYPNGTYFYWPATQDWMYYQGGHIHPCDNPPKELLTWILIHGDDR